MSGRVMDTGPYASRPRRPLRERASSGSAPEPLGRRRRRPHPAYRFGDPAPFPHQHRVQLRAEAGRRPRRTPRRAVTPRAPALACSRAFATRSDAALRAATPSNRPRAPRRRPPSPRPASRDREGPAPPVRVEDLATRALDQLGRRAPSGIRLPGSGPDDRARPLGGPPPGGWPSSGTRSRPPAPTSRVLPPRRPPMVVPA